MIPHVDHQANNQAFFKRRRAAISIFLAALYHALDPGMPGAKVESDPQSIVTDEGRRDQ